ncbi:MAG: site-2 protease family protein, partial [Holophagales bacterium]|nr:site-2 protease family protein [Holophagales bacterium]
ENDPPGPAPQPPTRRRRLLPLWLFVLTCLSTYLVGGPTYALALITILLCHEMGHFVQARRYGVPASLPYFIPMPIPPFGTMGAVILMQQGRATSRQLFDIAVSGPIGGLVPTFVFGVIGIRLSTFLPSDAPSENTFQLGEPLVFRWLVRLVVDVPEGMTLLLHPLAYAAWVGIFITALNLLPIGQLDGGHVVYTLLPKHAHHVSRALMVAWIVVSIVQGYWHWTLMIVLLLFLVGIRHPPVHREEKLGPIRTALGWLMLAVFVLGFTLDPFPGLR